MNQDSDLAERRVGDVALVNTANTKYLLVQYVNQHDASLVQKMVPENEIIWLGTNNMVTWAKLPNGCIAHVLHGFELHDYLEKLLLYLKTCCFDQIYDNRLDFDRMDENTWMLIQYCPDAETVVYQLIKYQPTVWHQENIFKDVASHMPLADSDTLLQAVVLSYGPQLEPLLAKYEKLKNFALQLEMPEAVDLDIMLQASDSAVFFVYNNPLQLAEARDITGEHRKMRRTLMYMGLKAEIEGDLLDTAFAMVFILFRQRIIECSSLSKMLSCGSRIWNFFYKYYCMSLREE